MTGRFGHLLSAPLSHSVQIYAGTNHHHHCIVPTDVSRDHVHQQLSLQPWTPNQWRVHKVEQVVLWQPTPQASQENHLDVVYSLSRVSCLHEYSMLIFQSALLFTGIEFASVWEGKRLYHK